MTPGNVNTLEGGLSMAVTKTVDVGAVGYWQQQMTDHTGPNTPDFRTRVFGAGPEVNIVWPSIGLITSLRYEYEFLAEHRPEGHTACLTLTKRF
jgi:hypothetical protein